MTSKPEVGRVVWYELLTTDTAAATAFYTEVIGWKAERFGDYPMWVSAQGPLGIANELPAPARAMGIPPYWTCSVEVADADATAELAKARGGKVYVIETVPGVGRLAVIGDPQGAVITAVAATREMPAHDRARHGEFSWHELYTSDQAAGLAFYGELFGWKRIAEHDIGPMGTYVVFGRGTTPLGGAVTLPPGMTTPDGRPVPPSWMYYVTVDDLEGALARATARGAKVLNGPMPVPGGQRIVQLLDPQGAAFALTTAPT
jgi:uncharacterized protein